MKVRVLKWIWCEVGGLVGGSLFVFVLHRAYPHVTQQLGWWMASISGITVGRATEFDKFIAWFVFQRMLFLCRLQHPLRDGGKKPSLRSCADSLATVQQVDLRILHGHSQLKCASECAAMQSPGPGHALLQLRYVLLPLQKTTQTVTLP